MVRISQVTQWLPCFPMRRSRFPVVGVLIVVVLLVAGCGSDGPQGVRTDTIAPGTRVEAQVYLNDSAELAATVRSYVASLDAVGDTITAAQAREIAPQLEESAARGRALCNRLAAQRLEDGRLEAQRQAVVEPLNEVCTSMEQIARLAAAGQVRPLEVRAQDLVGHFDRVREASAR